MALLDSQIAVVTGAGSGIGAAIAKGFAREGAGRTSCSVPTSYFGG